MAARRNLFTSFPATLAVACLAFSSIASAQSERSQTTPGIYIQAGGTQMETQAWTIGATLPWQSWERSFWGAEVRGYWDIYLSQWTSNLRDERNERPRTTLFGITPSFRFIPDGGTSPWFFDAGVGATLANHRYVTRNKTFSTRFNFATHLGVGVLLGAQRQHELQLRLEHVSNAGIKKPNPGANFLQLRYALHF